eukprot:Clim_evm8s244 gene=Clim_evmTU8s244
MSHPVRKIFPVITNKIFWRHLLQIRDLLNHLTPSIGIGDRSSFRCRLVSNLKLTALIAVGLTGFTVTGAAPVDDLVETGDLSVQTKYDVNGVERKLTRPDKDTLVVEDDLATITTRVQWNDKWEKHGIQMVICAKKRILPGWTVAVSLTEGQQIEYAYGFKYDMLWEKNIAMLGSTGEYNVYGEAGQCFYLSWGGINRESTDAQLPSDVEFLPAKKYWWLY